MPQNADYLTRIGYSGLQSPDLASLRRLHRAHLFHVPFENLDIGIGRPIVCDQSCFLNKIVNEKRGVGAPRAAPRCGRAKATKSTR